MGEFEGATARLELDQMPCKALPSKASNSRSEDFRAAVQCESNGIFRLSKKFDDFFDSLRPLPLCRRHGPGY